MGTNETTFSNKKFIVAFILSSCFIAAVFTYLYVDLDQRLRSISITSGVFSPISLTPDEIYDKVADSVVLVAKREKELGKTVTVSFCSGFIYDKKHVITVYNVIEDADEIRVVFENKTGVNAELLGFDEYSNLAILELNGTVSQKPLNFGDSSQVHLAERIYIVGKAYGTENLLITGEINRLRLPLILKDNFPLVDVTKFSAGTLRLETLGAPLLNSKGDIIGMLITLADENSSVTTLGYAVSSKMMKKIIPSIIENGKYEHLWLKGVWGTDLSQEIAEKMNLNFTRGFLVEYVDSRGAFGTEKLQIGDIIIKVDNVEVDGIYDIVSYLEENRKNRVLLTVFRDNEVLDTPIAWRVDAFSPPPD